jgi:uncharacterized protein YjbI with pentapeptide repeats
MKRKTVWWWILGAGLLLYLYPFYCLGLNSLFQWDFGRLYTFGLELKDFMTVWIALGGVVAVVGGIFQTQRRITLQEKQFNKQDEQFRAQTELQMKQQRDARFASGVELLGNPHESTRIGGAYNLYFLARDFEELRPAVCEILCAHLRSIAHKSKFETEEQRAKYPRNEVQSIIDLLFRKHETDESGEEVSIFLNQPKNLREICLSEIDFGKQEEDFVPKLSYVDFWRATLTDIRLGFAILSEVNFWGTSLTRVEFVRAALTEVSFWEATLSEAYFTGATLTEISFVEVILTGVGFFGTTLINTNFSNCPLIYVDFSKAKLEGTVDFAGTLLEGYSYEEITLPGFSRKKTFKKATQPAE